MSDLSKRRVYIMDCEEYVKIGVSCNAEQRKNQLPCRISQYYCTEPIENAFEIERFMHRVFSPKRKDCEMGREYFEIGFQCACNMLKSAIESSEDKRKQVESAVKELYLQNSDKFDRDFYRFVSLVLNSDMPDLTFLMFILKGLKARTYLRDKEIADSGKKKELQEV